MRLSAQLRPDTEANAAADAGSAAAVTATAARPAVDRLPPPGQAVPPAERGLPRSARGLRADATRNRLAILTAARQVFAEQGLRAPLEEIARRADVGIATLYRRFPTRE